MIQKKICMLGAFAVGKTSLVSRYVSSIFSETYLSTVGVKIDKKAMSVSGQDITLVLWDIYGADRFQAMQASYVRGAAGYLLVADGTRFETLDEARQLQAFTANIIGSAPFVLALNKADLSKEWQVDEKTLIKIADQGWPIVRTSAKTGQGVETAFEMLAHAMMERHE